jgi:hypothetical protein
MGWDRTWIKLHVNYSPRRPAALKVPTMYCVCTDRRTVQYSVHDNCLDKSFVWLPNALQLWRPLASRLESFGWQPPSCGVGCLVFGVCCSSQRHVQLSAFCIKGQFACRPDRHVFGVLQLRLRYTVAATPSPVRETSYQRRSSKAVRNDTIDR